MIDQDNTFEQDGLRIRVTRARGSGKMVWTGSSDSRQPNQFLTPVIRRVVEAMKGAHLTIDFRKLEYMNSSTVSSILSLLKSLDREEIETDVVFADSDWQLTHLRCMRTVTRVLKFITVGGESDGLPRSEK